MQKDRVEVFLIISLMTAVIATFLIVSFYPTKCNARIVSEGFSTSDSQLTMCPFGSRPMYTSKGESVCCNGRVNGTQCEGKLLCTFSAPTSTLKTCKALVDDYMNEKKRKYCPMDLPNYFEKNLGGCTNGRLLADRTAPVDASSEKCDVYGNDYWDSVIPTSCKNRVTDQFRPVHGRKIPFTIKQNYILRFTVNQYERVPQWSNIFHFTTTNTDMGTPGCRTPAVWFWPGSSSIHIIIGDMNDFNWGYHHSEDLPMNQDNSVVIICKDKNVSIGINGRFQMITQPSRRPEGQGFLYTSDPWYPPAKVAVTKFSYTPL